MADDSLEILEEHAFHPADPPHGMRSYDLGSLKPVQQKTLNKMKMIQRVENENYFKSHPEIKGLISILLSHILCKKPFSNVHETVGSFFTRPVPEITAELMQYLVDNCYSGPIMDTLREEIAKLEEGTSTGGENSIIPQKPSVKSLETSSESIVGEIRTDT